MGQLSEKLIISVSGPAVTQQVLEQKNRWPLGIQQQHLIRSCVHPCSGLAFLVAAFPLLRSLNLSVEETRGKGKIA